MKKKRLLGGGLLVMMVVVVVIMVMMMIMPSGFAKKTGSARLDRCHFEACSQEGPYKVHLLYDYGDDGGGTGDDDDGGDGEDSDDSTVQAARKITYKVHFVTDLIVG